MIVTINFFKFHNMERSQTTGHSNSTQKLFRKFMYPLMINHQRKPNKTIEKKRNQLKRQFDDTLSHKQDLIKTFVWYEACIMNIIRC